MFYYSNNRPKEKEF